MPLVVARAMARCFHTMHSYKLYMLMVVLPYIFLLLIFHLQLQFYDHVSLGHHLVESEDRSASDIGLIPPPIIIKGDKDSFHFRDLMIKENSDLYSAKSEYEKHFKPVKPDIPLPTEIPVVQQAAGDFDNINVPHVIRVSRTFENGTRIVKRQVLSPESESQRLLLEDGTDQLSQQLKNKILSYYRDINNKSMQPRSVMFPLTDQCERHYRGRQADLQDLALFRYIGGTYILSAFLDSRIESDPPFIRIITLIKRGYQPALFCHFPYRKCALSGCAPGKDDIQYATTMGLFYEMCENHNKDYGGWIVSCIVPSVFTDYGQTPCEVTLSKQSTYSADAQGAINIPVFTTRGASPEPKTSFAVCVPPLFGHIPSTTLVEFVELSRLLGASHVMFYAHQVTAAIQKVLEYYQDKGVVSVISWDLPVRERSIWYHGQLLAINDCLYRSMHRFSHVIFNDIDEFLVPHQFDTWQDMTAFIESNSTNHTQSGFSFQSAFFDPLVNGNSKILYDLESDLRTKVFSKVRSKVMVRPQRIFELGIHHISRPVSPDMEQVNVEAEVAFVHHYRKCMMDFDPHMRCQVYARDESLTRYVPALRHKVHETLWILKEIDDLGRHGGGKQPL